MPDFRRRCIFHVDVSIPLSMSPQLLFGLPNHWSDPNMVTVIHISSVTQLYHLYFRQKHPPATTGPSIFGVPDDLNLCLKSKTVAQGGDVLKMEPDVFSPPVDDDSIWKICAKLVFQQRISRAHHKSLLIVFTVRQGIYWFVCYRCFYLYKILTWAVTLN